MRAKSIIESFALTGKIALVTGANSGIGREIAFALAQAGAAVVLVARRAAALEATKQFLASPAAAYVTGQTIFVDGGFSAS